MSLFSVFVGVPQSKLAGTAILLAVVVVGLTILFGKGAVPVSQKLAVALMMFLLSLPAILLTLFQLNCMVTGSGFKNQRWWCSLYAWFVAIMILFYSVVLVIVALMNMANDKAVEKFQNASEEATSAAKEYFETQEAKVEVKGPVMEGPAMGGAGAVGAPGDASAVLPTVGAEPPVPEDEAALEGFESLEEPFSSCAGAPLN